MTRQFNEAQRQAIAHFDGPCLTLAGPGSGKTTVIVERILSLIKRGVPARNILVLTFTRAAALEMRERFFKRIQEEMQKDAETGRNQAGSLACPPSGSSAHSVLASGRQVSFGTFHSAFFQILRYSGGYDGGSVVQGAAKAALLEEVSKGLGIYHDREGWYQEVLKEISDVKGNGISPEDYRPNSCTPREFAALFRGYQELLKSRKKLDFDDMLSRCLELFNQRPDILEIWQERCRYILIDEYQDSSRIQCQLAELLARPENNLMVVGDDDQSIYGFRGAAPERMRDFLQTYPDAKQYVLNINYRCRPDIVKAAGRLIGCNENRLPKEIRAAKKDKTQGKMAGKAGASAAETITVEEFPTLREENEAIIEKILRYHREGLAYGEMAVLYRTNRNPAQLLRLMENQGIPVQVKGGPGGIYSHFICQDFCAYLAAAAGSTRRADWLRVISHPERYISRSALGREPVSLDDLFAYYEEDERRLDQLDRLSYDLALLKKAPPYAGLSHLRRYMGYDDYLEELDKTGEGRLHETAEQLQETADGCRNGMEWLRYVDRQLRAPQEKNAGPSGDSVHFMTMHGAKGLEFPVVFLADANEGITPYKRAETPEALEEERRLFYVAMTRAKDRLHISYTKERFHRSQSESRFIRESGLV